MSEKLEKKILSKLKSNRKELVKLCSDLLSIKNENPPGDMTEIAGFVKDYIKASGCECQVVEPQKGRISVLSHLGEKEQPNLILNGHMDVVPAGDPTRWSFNPYGGEVRDGLLLGRGASDMKCGLAAMMFSFRNIAESDVPLKSKVTLMVVPDEETGSRFGTRHLLEKKIVTGDACIIGEPTGPNLVEIGQKGSVGGTIRVNGSPIHSSLSPIRGDSAIMKMAKLIPQLQELHEVEFPTPPEIKSVVEDNKILYRELAGEGAEKMLSHASVNFGVIRGGTKSNVVAESCECTLDMRIPQGAKHMDVIQMLHNAIKESGIDGVTLDVRGRDAFYISPEEHIVKVVGNSVEKALGTPPRLFIQWACSDVAAFHQKNIPTVQYGPHGSGIHGYDEKIQVEAVENAAKVYSLAILNF